MEGHKTNLDVCRFSHVLASFVVSGLVKISTLSDLSEHKGIIFQVHCKRK
ncbi:hypothetical protein NSE_0109 [Neorickettsia sennetsu str. Miyayama]|uniref:Uncharacterized protein n=1 Tax=Ehrlichia sennetsu (strain ATCC VR-367 / Miyayama) TaxID=222891 RepID=Q2GET7_EHRS3|nr:hypothetical protein NSE_0109 [Neorickettsia sennetsu str. Miyayama]